MNKPSMITIGMPFFNCIDFIEKSIKGILSPSFKEFILLKSYDGSTDASTAICIKYSETDSRTKYIKQKRNIGISENLEFLLYSEDTECFMCDADYDFGGENSLSFTAFSTFNNINKNFKDIQSLMSFETFKSLIK